METQTYLQLSRLFAPIATAGLDHSSAIVLDCTVSAKMENGGVASLVLPPSALPPPIPMTVSLPPPSVTMSPAVPLLPPPVASLPPAPPVSLPPVVLPPPPTTPLSGGRTSPVRRLHSPLHIASTTTGMIPLKMEKAIYSSPTPSAISNHPNNACHLIDYRGARVAAFVVNGRQLICLPQSFDLFLKHLVGGLHTVYTKLKRLDISPVVCNVEQVRILRGLGAIQPGVNRCKLLAPSEFDILYGDCTNSSARPGRPPKRASFLAGTPDTPDKVKKSRLEGLDYAYSPAGLLAGMKKTAMFPGGYPYPTHLPFMPMGHPAVMNFAMANHLGMRHEPTPLITEQRHDGADIAAHRLSAHEARYPEPNNNVSKHDGDMPLNLESVHKADNRFMTDRDSVASTGSDIMSNGQLDLSMKPAAHINSMLDDFNVESDSDDLDELDDEAELPNLVANIPQGGDTAVRLAADAHKTTAHNSQQGALHDGVNSMSSIDTLLINIQGLLKVAAENARHHEQQRNYENAELKLELLREREVRDKLENQLTAEVNSKVLLHKRLKREKKVRRKLQDQLAASDDQNSRAQPPPQQPSALPPQHTLPPSLACTEASLPPIHRRHNSDSVSEDSDEERHVSYSHTERHLQENRISGIQNLMETFLSSTQKSSPACSVANGYLHAPIVKQGEAV